ncbi:hypothetical protein F2Q69_00011451 [Brassica cretica]|uniref:Uncharacterized protein n=1 Tax=Brassica cretica TaxID=69181 RepID=A0A8S9R847_BRACR|nr:hypothetical protein F2Q69_00011451 [Brassica cretica]
MHIVAFLEMANKVEASTNIWRRRAHSRHLISRYRSTGARPPWGDDSERDDESNGSVVVAQSSAGVSSVNQLRAEHSTLLGRLGDMNQKYDAAAVDNRILRADIETREQKRNSEKSDGSEPLAVGKTKHVHASEQHTENPKYYWYRFITKQRVEVNREGLQNQFATNPKNMYETIGITSINHKIDEQHTENPKYYWYRFITKQRVEVNREGLQNQFATNPKNMYETIGITSINHKIESSTL